jgi:hypothetical protein
VEPPSQRSEERLAGALQWTSVDADLQRQETGFACSLREVPSALARFNWGNILPRAPCSTEVVGPLCFFSQIVMRGGTFFLLRRFPKGGIMWMSSRTRREEMTVTKANPPKGGDAKPRA